MVQVTAGRGPAATRRGAPGAAGADQVPEFAAGPVLGLGPGVVAVAAGDRDQPAARAAQVILRPGAGRRVRTETRTTGDGEVGAARRRVAVRDSRRRAAEMIPSSWSSEQPARPAPSSPVTVSTTAASSAPGAIVSDAPPWQKPARVSCPAGRVMYRPCSGPGDGPGSLGPGRGQTRRATSTVTEEALAEAGDLAHLVHGVQGGDLVGLGQGGVVEHRVDQVVDGAAAAHHGLADVNDLRGAGAEDVNAE